VPDKIVQPPLHTAPAVFTRALLDWLPWLEPLAEEGLTERQMAGLVDAVRAKSPYFRLLARDPDALRARTLADKDIFYNPEAGLPRGERELAAAATSRFNGCIYCASVHARHSATYSKRAEDVQRLLDEGIRRSRRALERHHRRLRRAQRDADRLRVGACGAAASRRARRSGDRRCHPCGGLLQLGQSADVVAWRTRPAGRGIAISIRAATVLLPMCRSPAARSGMRRNQKRTGAARHGNRRASPRDRPAASTGALDAALQDICSHPGMWRATSRDIVQHFSGSATGTIGDCPSITAYNCPSIDAASQVCPVPAASAPA